MKTRHTTAEALAAIGDVLSGIDHGQRAALSADELLHLRARAKQIRERVAAPECALMAEIDERQASMRAAGTSLTAFVALADQVDSKQAAAQVFQAQEVARHTKVRTAALDGDVSVSHAQAISKAMQALPAKLDAEQRDRAEELLLEQAATSTPRQLAEAAPAVLAEVAPELVPSPEDEAVRLDAQFKRARARRYFRYGDDGDGSTWFKGSLPHLDAAPLIRQIETSVESGRRTARNHNEGLLSLKPGPKALRENRREDAALTPAQRRADALALLSADLRGTPTVAGERPRIVVTMSEESLRQRAEQAGVLDTGARIGPGALRRLCCDADLTPAVLGTGSQLLDVGQDYRLVTPSIRRALTIRDRGCIFPNCSEPDTRCEAHHITPWWAGGPTSLQNLALVCPFHHATLEPDRFDPQADQWRIVMEEGMPRVQAPRKARPHLRSRSPYSEPGTSEHTAPAPRGSPVHAGSQHAPGVSPAHP